MEKNYVEVIFIAENISEETAPHHNTRVIVYHCGDSIADKKKVGTVEFENGG